MHFFIAKIFTSIVELAPESGQLALSIFLMLWFSGLISAFVDNVPWCITMTSVIQLFSQSLGLNPSTLAWALVYSANLGGNGTLIGASSNVIAVESLKSRNIVVSFVDFLKVGAPALVIQMIIPTIYMMIIYVGIGYEW